MIGDDFDFEPDVCLRIDVRIRADRLRLLYRQSFHVPFSALVVIKGRRL